MKIALGGATVHHTTSMDCESLHSHCVANRESSDYTTSATLSFANGIVSDFQHVLSPDPRHGHPASLRRRTWQPPCPTEKASSPMRWANRPTSTWGSWPGRCGSVPVPPGCSAYSVRMWCGSGQPTTSIRFSADCCVSGWDTCGFICPGGTPVTRVHHLAEALARRAV